MLFIILILTIMSLVYGIHFWKKSRLLSLFLFSPVFLILLFIGFVVFNFNYHTSRDSLEFSIQKEKQTYTVKGVWVKPLDAYRSSTESFSTDFIVFYLPNKMEISKVSRNRNDNTNIYLSDYKGLVQNCIENDNPSISNPEIFDIRTSKKFSFSFALPKDANPKDVKIFYVHTREEPMSNPEFWYKKINLK
ncbi:MAG: hypothetical protein K0R18_2493 [Bacillales bacterium]|jgi:energy-coupling factor transporter transmembrane protein EcfT|nr:hypothetical protein [Bacillales bacterium]